jgi:ribosome modulation factor
MGEYVSDKHITPQFSQNRDLTDEPYAQGYEDALAGRTSQSAEYERQSHRKAYANGYYAGSLRREAATVAMKARQGASE